METENVVDLSGNAQRGTIGTIASFASWLLLFALVIVTAVHAISVTMAYTNLSTTGGNLFAIVRIGGVVLVEAFAATTAVLLASHKLRAKQKPVAMAVEGLWVIFAAANMTASFAIEHGGEVPQFVAGWVAYGLPVSALVMGVAFYAMLRLNPDMARADDEAELDNKFRMVKHNARMEVLDSQQMRAVIRQATWQQLPPIIGRQLNLSEQQIATLVKQAPQLLDLNNNGVPDIQETGNGRGNSGQGHTMTMADLQRFLAEQPVATGVNGHGPNGDAHFFGQER